MLFIDAAIAGGLILCWLLSAIFCYKSLCILIEPKEGLLCKLVLIAACFFATQMVMYIGDLYNLPPTMVFFVSAVWWCCKGSGWKRITIAFMICVAAFSVSALLDSYIFLSNHFSAALRMPFWALIWLILRRQTPPKNYQLKDTMWKLLLGLTLTPLGIVLSIMLLQSPFSRDLKGAALSNIILFLIAIFSLVGLLQVIPLLAKKEKLEEENQLYQINRAYYENLERQQGEIRILRHDLANHLQVLAVLEGQEKKAYIQKLGAGAAVGRTVKFCDNQVINSVMNGKFSFIEKEQIRWTAEIEVPAELPIDAVDLCAVFANGLDNAIESCLKMRPQERFIDIRAKAAKGIFALKIINAAQQAQLEKGLPKSTKKEANHGFGLRSIEHIVRRYEGKLELSLENHCFTLFLYLPFPSESGAGKAAEPMA